MKYFWSKTEVEKQLEKIIIFITLFMKHSSLIDFAKINTKIEF